MIGRKAPRIDDDLDDAPKLKGFDDFDLRLGDTMRGERATMGKSLLDVQRELRIKASYIAAIENSDPSAFDTPGFIANRQNRDSAPISCIAPWVWSSIPSDAPPEEMITSHSSSAV